MKAKTTRPIRLEEARLIIVSITVDYNDEDPAHLALDAAMNSVRNSKRGKITSKDTHPDTPGADFEHHITLTVEVCTAWGRPRR